MASKKVLLMYGERRKVMELASSKSEPDKTTVINHVRRAFNLLGHQIYPQEYSDDFDEWVDIENDFVAQRKHKIKIVSIAPVVPNKSLKSAHTSHLDQEVVIPNPLEKHQSTEVVPNKSLKSAHTSHLDQEVVIPNPLEKHQSTKSSLADDQLDNQPEGSFDTHYLTMQVLLPEDTSQSALTMTTVESLKTSPVMSAVMAYSTPPLRPVKDKHVSLPRPFSLPDNYSPIVMSGLKQGMLSGKAMTKFITEVAAAIYRHKSYPTKEEKEHVALQCVKRYPFLESSRGNGFGYLFAGLTERLKYMRRPLKRPAIPSADKPSPKISKLVKPTSFTPAQSAGEDVASHKKNIEVIQSMALLPNPDPACVDDLMARTFAYRRSCLEDESYQFTIESFLTTYPLLRRESEIVKEFNRVVQAQLKSFMLCKLAWLECVPKILTVAKNESDPHIQRLVQQLDDSTNEGALSLLAAILLSNLLVDPRFKADHNRIVTIVPENGDIAKAAATGGNNQARILAVGGISTGIKEICMVLEKKVLFRISQLSDAIPLLFCMFFVFNLSYAPGANSFYLFLEHVLLQTKAAANKHSISKLIVRLGL